MSVRIKPTQAQIDEAETLYARMRAEAESGRVTLVLRGGKLCHTGWRAWPERVRGISLTGRIAGGLAVMALAMLVPDVVGLHDGTALLCRLGLGAAGVAGFTWVFHRRFAGAMQEAERFASDLAGCNLTTDVPTDFPGSLGALMRALRQIQVNLRAVIDDVRRGVEGFSHAAKEIAQGSVSLSERAESGASNLQETASAMEELTGTISQTAATTAAISQKSGECVTTATQGSQAVGEVREAMKNLQGSSARMSDIVSTIEGIAFQTNLLALNAAVEAARAGEQGRGFAVVAGEVRALAQRSADAAREIGGLIHSLVEGIANSASQMADVGQSMDAMVTSVQHVSDQVGDITTAAREQSAGVGQVNQAVAQLDSTMQQNAALAEEYAAAAQALRDLARSIDRSVAVFHLA
ncbi:chemotaxis protein [Comamonas flocculans]|uniref:Chemotaxis protein n=1 Tax=Comamonas flocculans TaxID=2597701 RepID=A0A5B8RU39_9BURK|nr:chemotaxis protein [Comamonas flocculans]